MIDDKLFDKSPEKKKPHFLGGLSTDPEVTKLMAEIPPTIGTRVPYEVIENLISVKHTEHRFRTVTNRWRKQLLRDKFIRVIAIDESFQFLTADETLALNQRELHRIGRHTGRLLIRNRMIEANDLTSDEKRESHRLLNRVAGELREHFDKGFKELAAPKPVSSLRMIK